MLQSAQHSDPLNTKTSDEVVWAADCAALEPFKHKNPLQGFVGADRAALGPLNTKTSDEVVWAADCAALEPFKHKNL
jgi:hypothetical protein